MTEMTFTKTWSTVTRADAWRECRKPFWSA